MKARGTLPRRRAPRDYDPIPPSDGLMPGELESTLVGAGSPYLSCTQSVLQYGSWTRGDAGWVGHIPRQSHPPDRPDHALRRPTSGQTGGVEARATFTGLSTRERERKKE